MHATLDRGDPVRAAAKALDTRVLGNPTASATQVQAAARAFGAWLDTLLDGH